MKIRTLSQVINLELKEEFLISRILPKAALCALVGDSEAGKTELALQMSIAIASGRNEFLGIRLNPEHRGVLVITTEDSPFSLKKRLTRLLKGQTGSALEIRFGTDVEKNPVSEIREHIEKIGGLDLIIIDGWLDFFEGDINNSPGVRQFFREYRALAEQNGCCILFLHHYVKSSQSKRNHEKRDILGSQGIEAVMRTITSLEVDSRSGTRTLQIIKSNLISDKEKKEFQKKLRFNDHWEFETLEGSPIQDLKESENKMEFAKSEIIKRGWNEKSAREIAELFGKEKREIGKSTIAKALRELKESKTQGNRHTETN